MSGAAHLRIVVALFIVGGILALAPYVASLFQKTSTFSPFGWVGGLATSLSPYGFRADRTSRAIC